MCMDRDAPVLLRQCMVYYHIMLFHGDIKVHVPLLENLLHKKYEAKNNVN